jgi:Zinc-binding dehydrogenase
MGTVCGDLLNLCVRSTCRVAQTRADRTLRFRGRCAGREERCIGTPCTCLCSCPAQRAVEIQALRRHRCLPFPDYVGLEELAKLITDGQLQPNVEVAFPLEEAAAVHERLEARHTRGKIVLHLQTMNGTP